MATLILTLSLASNPRQGSKSSEVVTLGRGDCFGEQALVPADMMKKAKRKTSVTCHAHTPLVALALSADDLCTVESLDRWSRQLIADISANAVGGIDAVIMAKASSTVTATLLPQARKGKDGKAASRRGPVA